MLREELEEFNIFALREYARRTGVSSPTSKKKDVLITEILDIVEGRKAPNVSNKFGRPPKEFHADVFGIRDNVGSVNSFNQNGSYFDYSVFKDGRISGYLEQNNNNFILNVYTDGKVLKYFIPQDISNKYDLRDGDKLTVDMSKRGESLTIDTLVGINDVAPEEFNNLRPNIQNIKHQNTKSILFSYGDLKVSPADIVYLKGVSNIKNSLTLIDMVNKSNKTKNIYLNISLIEKRLTMLEELRNSTNFTAVITDEAEYIESITKSAICYAERLVESGYDVVFAIDDLMSIKKLCDGENLSRRILSLAKNGERGSLTLLCVMPTDDSLAEFEKLCDKIYYVE